MKYVFHVDHVQDWATALSNMKNTVGLSGNKSVAMSEDEPIGLGGKNTVAPGGNEVVAVINGTAVYAVQGISDWTQAMQELARVGVRFEICNNALTGHRIPRETLPQWLHVVSSAIPAIAEYQQRGYAYIKP